MAYEMELKMDVETPKPVPDEATRREAVVDRARDRRKNFCEGIVLAVANLTQQPVDFVAKVLREVPLVVGHLVHHHPLEQMTLCNSKSRPFN